MTSKTRPGALLTLTTCDARRLLMARQGLLDDPRDQATSRASLLRLIEQMGYVQIDTISTVERAHHLIVASRSDAYRAPWLETLAGEQRKLFEHWTHDASFIPTRWFAHWRHRFERYRSIGWHRKQMGDDADRVVQHVLERIRSEGPLRSADFEHDGERHPQAWWGWKPQKVALDYLWRIGELYIVGRKNFQKIYDLTERAVPEHHAVPHVSEEEHVDWACTSALERLGVANASEITDFWRAVKLPRVRSWLGNAVSDRRVVPVQIVSENQPEKPRLAYVLPDVQRGLKRLNDRPPPSQMRLLCPFDPVLRDRKRLKRLFDFDHTFEGFVPPAKRRFGYYVMPLLRGEKLIGRVDPKFHREEGVLRIQKVWWEPGIRVEARLKRELESACERLAKFLGAERVEVIRERSPGTESRQRSGAGIS